MPDSDISVLLDNLSNEDAADHLAAADALRGLGESAIEPLMMLLSNAGAPMEGRWRAAVLLGWAGSQQAVNSLIVALEDQEWAVRHSAVWALGQIGDGRAVKPLTIILCDRVNEEYEQLRHVAALALAWIGDEQAIEALRLAAESDDVRLRRAAGAALMVMTYWAAERFRSK